MQRRTWDPTIPALIAAVVMLVGTVAATGGIPPGQWRGELGSDSQSVRLDVRLAAGNSRTSISTDVATAELEGFDAAAFGRPGAPLRLAWKRDAGTFVLEGEGGRRPGGKVRFEPNPAFGERWRALGFETLGENDFLRLAVENIRLADVERLNELGLHLDVDDLFRLRSHGVSLDDVRAYQSAGVRVDLEGILRLHAHGVPTDYVAQVRSSGFADVDDLVRLHDQGVEAEYVRGMVDAHLPGMTVDDIIRLHAHGVPAGYARAIVEIGPGPRDADDVIRLHNYGVSAEFVRSLAQAGHGELTVDEVIRAETRGVESLGNPAGSVQTR
jgi:hypothetical protein